MTSLPRSTHPLDIANQFAALTEHDRAELAKFKLYLEECDRWDDANDTLPNFAPISEVQRKDWVLKQIRAHAAIYEQIYGEKP